MKIISLISGGIDSAVSTGLALREPNTEVIALHLNNYPFSGKETEEKIEKILRVLAKKFGKKIKFIIAPHGETLKEIVKNCSRKHTCILCRGFMLKTAEAVAEREGAEALLTGESLGQVASQTLSNLLTTGRAISIPVLRPLIGLDKIEIERIARGFGTFAPSIEKGGCCEIVPERPATRSQKEFIESEERKINEKELINNSVKGLRVKVIG